MAVVTFDGPTKIISIDQGVTAIDVKVDLYSAWKEWVTVGDNSKYLPAMRATGGDPLPGNRYLGDTYFLTNDWKIRPHEADHRLTVTGNLYCDDGSEPFLDTLGPYRVTVVMTVSDLVVQVGGADSSSIANAVWGRQLSNSPTAGSVEEALRNIRDEAMGRWVLDSQANTLTLYRLDGTTVLRTFNLTPAGGLVPAYVARAPV